MENNLNYFDLYKKCTLCPNNCSIDRSVGNRGICGENSTVRIAWSGLHKGEEPPISGINGSGMIFFSGCPLHCAFCQNYQISLGGGKSEGVTISVEELSDVMLELQKFGAETLNLVTGTHFIPSIIIALDIAKNKGFTLPVVWNSGGYENVSSIRLIDSYIDVYLLDVKSIDCDVSEKFCGKRGYVQAVLPLVRFLKRRRPKTILDKGNLSGVLVRHLVFPGTLDATVDFLKLYAENFKDNFTLSVMTQFISPKDDIVFNELSSNEYDYLLDIIDGLGIDGYIQEETTNKKEALWIPDFTKDNPFPENFAKVLPYFLELKRNKQKTEK